MPWHLNLGRRSPPSQKRTSCRGDLPFLLRAMSASVCGTGGRGHSPKGEMEVLRQMQCKQCGRKTYSPSPQLPSPMMLLVLRSEGRQSHLLARIVREVAGGDPSTVYKPTLRQINIAPDGTYLHSQNVPALSLFSHSSEGVILYDANARKDESQVTSISIGLPTPLDCQTI